MSTLFPDTSPEAEAVLIRLLREAPPWRKLEMVDQLNALRTQTSQIHPRFLVLQIHKF